MVFTNKKGFSGFAIAIIVLLFIFGGVYIVLNKSFGELNDIIQEDDTLGNTSKEMINDLDTRFSTTFDGGFAFAFVLLYIVLLLISWYSDSSPALQIVAILMMVFIGLGALLLGTVWSDMTSDVQLSTELADFPFMNFILGNYLVVALAMISGMIAAMYLKQAYG